MKKILFLFVIIHMSIWTKAQSNEVMFHFGDGFAKDTVSFYINDVLIFDNQIFEHPKKFSFSATFRFQGKDTLCIKSVSKYKSIKFASHCALFNDTFTFIFICNGREHQQIIDLNEGRYLYIMMVRKYTDDEYKSMWLIQQKEEKGLD